MAIDETRTFKPINIAVLTVSDTRTAADDTSGDILAERVKAETTLPLALGFGLSRPEFGQEFAGFLHELIAMQKAAQ